MITKETIKVYCIKDYSNRTCSFYKNNYYKVQIQKNVLSDVRIFDDLNRGLYFYFPSIYNTSIINEHFITEKELRKLKLDKLNSL